MNLSSHIISGALNAFRRFKTVIVVEIGNDWLKVVEGRVDAAGVSIAKSRFVKLSQIKESISDTISQIFKELKLDKQAVITYLPRNLVTVRLLELPSVNPEEISSIINLQIGKQTPYSKEEIVSSFRQIGSDRQDYTRVMLVIVRRNLIDERLDALSKAAINARDVTLSSEGVYSWFNTVHLPKLKIDNSQAVILIDIDSNYSDFIVIHNGNLRFSKNILIGANHLLEERENYLPKFIDELLHSRDAFHEESKTVKASKMFLSGAARGIKGLDIVLNQKLELPCQVLDAVSGPQAQANPDFLNDENRRFISISPVLGILLKYKELEFDLLPNEKRIQKITEKKRKNLTVMGILFCAITMVLSILVLIYIYNKNNYLAQLKQEIIAIKGDSDEIVKMRLSVSLAQDLLNARGDSLNLLGEINKIIPKEVYLTSLEVERRKQAVLRGRAQAMSDVFKFITMLEKSPYFENVKNTFATTKKEDNYEYTDFEISAAYEKPTNRR
jgi:Tfp pilus assembly PilM family ATPase/Tfp pilus assembly protein PilN